MVASRHGTGRFAVDAVFHFAALKAVGESVTLPLRYFDNNIGGMITLCQTMVDAGVDIFVFSSSATTSMSWIWPAAIWRP